MAKYICIFFITSLMCGCHHHGHDSRLEAIDRMVSAQPSQAIDSLEAIDCTTLSDADRHYHDLLLIKARDKAYVRHTSDSTILEAVKFYKGSDLYPEALYYAGRVYSDLGDAPSALDYFQSALDNVSPDSLILKGCILSQTSRLLDDLRLYREAIPYVVQAIKIDSVLCDTFNLVYDNVLLGQIYLNQGNHSNAGKHFLNAALLAQGRTDKDKAYIQMLRAAVKLQQNDVDSALVLVRGTPERTRAIQQNEAMIYASNIYLAAGLRDTAYYYADRIIHSPDPNNRKNGYRNLFSPELYPLIPADSIPVYIRHYNSALETFYNRHESQQALMQTAFYNYQIHQRERIKAESRNRTLTLSLVISIILSLILLCGFIFVAYRRKKILASQQTAVLELEQLRKSISLNNIPPFEDSDRNIIREKLKTEINLLQSQVTQPAVVSEHITKSTTYSQISNLLSEGKSISDKNSIWSDLEQLVLQTNPMFKHRLRLLVGQHLKPHDYHLVLLIKCGFTPAQTTILLGRTKGTISYRRRHVCEMILGEKIESSLIDRIIYNI